MTEAQLQRKIINYLKGERIYVINVTGSPHIPTGTPDLIACICGRFVGIEIKLPNGNYGLTTSQKLHLKRIMDNGGVGIKVTSVEEVKELVESINRDDYQRELLFYEEMDEED